MVALVPGLSALVDKYDVFIIDQYGVLHNGSVAHPGAIECFHRLLHEQRKKVVILSNTSRRACGVLTLLASLGFSDSFHGAVTGGEAAWHYLQGKHDTMRTCALMTASMERTVLRRDSDPQSLFYGLDDLKVSPIQDADFLLVEGSLQICYSNRLEDTIAIDFHSTGEVTDSIEAFLRDGLARGLPMVCTNPDLVSIQHGGKTVHMGGKIAQMYEARGGQVLYFGKPLKEHFEACMELAQCRDRSRVLHIGDSMHHDIQGAINTGIDSLFIAGGIHGHELEVSLGPGQPVMNQERLPAFWDEFGFAPTYATPGFRWE